jgi:hypothetical protein
LPDSARTHKADLPGGGGFQNCVAHIIAFLKPPV